MSLPFHPDVPASHEKPSGAPAGPRVSRNITSHAKQGNTPLRSLSIFQQAADSLTLSQVTSPAAAAAGAVTLTSGI